MFNLDPIDYKADEIIPANKDKQIKELDGVSRHCPTPCIETRKMNFLCVFLDPWNQNELGVCCLVADGFDRCVLL